jgi:hypothetical protein
MAFTLAYRLRHAEWRQESMSERLSRIEHSSVDSGAGPLVRLFGSRELCKALHMTGFPEVTIEQRHFGLKLNRQLPERLGDFVSRHAGWYLVFRAA